MNNQNLTKKSTNYFTAAYIILYLFFVLILYFLVKIVIIRKKYEPMFTWWARGAGKYDSFFSMFAAMASHESNFYLILHNIFGTSDSNITISQLNFLIQRIFPFTVSNDPAVNIPVRFVLPVHLCRDIKFHYSDGDRWFNKWVDDNKMDENVVLKYQSDNKTRANKGIYPSPDDYAGWRTLISEWAGGYVTWSAESGTSIFKPDFDTAGAWADKWFAGIDNDSVLLHPDNFLARYGITPDAPMIVSFVNNSYNDPATGIKFDSEAFRNLIGGGIEGVPGGWISYIHGVNAGTGEDALANNLYTVYATVKDDINKNGTKICSGTDTATSWITGITTGLGIAGMGLFLLANPWLAVIPVIAGIGAGVATGVNAQNKCSS